LGRKKQPPPQYQRELFRFPLSLHDSRSRMAVRAKQQMADFVCDGATQNYGYRVGSRGETHGISVGDTGERWRKGKTPESIVQSIPDVTSEYPKHYVNGFAPLMAQPLWVRSGVTGKTV